jgi:hypothetical protein
VSAIDLVAELEARLDAMREEARLETELDTTYQTFTADPTDKNKAAYQAVAVALRQSRSARRSTGVVVGGDAVKDEDGEG